ncbi:MAG TPA: carboxypeptidase-like regulatory domain-containing protein [Bryobacteraceae bacterium]
MRPQRATVRVEEAFKGVQKDQLIQIDQSGGDCGLKYGTGWRRLLYLSSQKDGQWLSPGCDRSTDPEEAPDDLEFLRALPASATRTRISGEVKLSGNPSHPIPGVTVTLTRSGGPPVTLVTDSKGVFEVYDLPRGTHAASVRVPQDLKLNFGYVSGPRIFSQKLPLTVTLGDSHATTVFYLQPADAK